MILIWKGLLTAENYQTPVDLNPQERADISRHLPVPLFHQNSNAAGEEGFSSDSLSHLLLPDCYYYYYYYYYYPWRIDNIATLFLPSPMFEPVETLGLGDEGRKRGIPLVLLRWIPFLLLAVAPVRDE